MVPVSLTPTAHAEVDYSKCAELFNNSDSREGNLKGYRITRHNTPLPKRVRYIPFDIEDDGRLTVHDHAIRSVERDSVGNVTKETVSYLSHPIEKLEKAGSEWMDISNEKGTQEVKVIVERNNDGHITAIIENVGLVTDELAEIERMRNWHDGVGVLAVAYVATRTEFQVAAGECVPLKRKDIVASIREGRRQQFEIPYFNTRVCRAIEEFSNDNPEFRATFDQDLNGRLAAVFAKHARELLVHDDPERDFLTYADRELRERGKGSILAKGQSRLDSLQLQILAGYISYTQVKTLRQKEHGASAVIFGHMVLADCYYHGLAAFFSSAKYWDQED